MSQENVEIARRGLAAWNAGDMDALRDLHDPDVIRRHVHTYVVRVLALMGAAGEIPPGGPRWT